MKLYQLLLLLLFTGTIYSCSPKTHPTASAKKMQPAANPDSIRPVAPAQGNPKQKIRRGYWKPDEVSLQISLEDFFKTHEAGYIFTADTVDFPVWTAMINLYQARNYQGIWPDEKKIREMVALVRTAEYDGLTPDDYHPDAIEAFLKKIKKDTSSQNQLQIELLATASLMRYCRDMWSGKVYPKAVFPEWNYQTRALPPEDTAVWEHLLTSDFDTLAAYLRPHIQMYEELRTDYQHLDELEKAGEEWPRIEYPGKDLKAGDTSTVLLSIKQRLYNMGLLLREPTDSIFDLTLRLALVDFQVNQGLPTTGLLDKKTIARLNFTLKEVKDIVRVNMERCRWLEPSSPEEYLLVNITGYELHYIKGKKIDFSTRIVVGNEEHRTKIFHANLVNVEFNPYWTVTRNIATEEILPILKRDPSYLDRNDMVLWRGEEIVDPYTLDFAMYSKDNFPFVVKQSPGYKNALGVVKFNMPNPYSIYMHDTPSKGDFEKNGRAFSHGCIRVYKPLDLAEYLLKKQGFSREQIETMVIKGDNVVIGLQKKVPVMITYWTYYKDIYSGKTVFYRDIYGRDQLVLNELNKKVTLKKNPLQTPKSNLVN